MSINLNGSQHRALLQYLANARASQIGAGGWTVSWKDCHGETRSSSTITFHIAIRLTSVGEHRSCIRVGSRPCQFIVAGSEAQWASQPSLSHILNEYKRMYNVDTTTPPSSSSSGEDNDKTGNEKGGKDKKDKGKTKDKGKGKGRGKGKNKGCNKRDKEALVGSNHAGAGSEGNAMAPSSGSKDYDGSM